MSTNATERLLRTVDEAEAAGMASPIASCLREAIEGLGSRPITWRDETTSEHIARDMAEGRFPEQSERQKVRVVAESKPRIDWKSSPPFITETSGFGEYYVTVKVHSSSELHAAHDLIINAFKREIFDEVIAGVIDAQIA